MPKPAPAPKPLNLVGTKGNDTLVGGALGDALNGLGGTDILIGNGGADTLLGGAEADTFKYVRFSDSVAATGIDTIKDFSASAGDKVDLTDLGSATLKTAYDANFTGLQAVFNYDAATNRTTLSYLQGSTTPVFQIRFTGNIAYTEAAFLGITPTYVPPTISVSDGTGPEGSKIVFTVSRTGDLSLPSSATYTASTGATGLVSFDAGIATATFSILTTNDKVIEEAESFTVTLSAPSNAIIGDGVAIGTIEDDDSPTEEADDIEGTAAADTIDLLGGDDIYDGLTGADVIKGGAGEDTLHGGLGDDTLVGGSEDDTLLGGADNDWMIGAEGDDTIDGGTGTTDRALFYLNPTNVGAYTLVDGADANTKLVTLVNGGTSEAIAEITVASDGTITVTGIGASAHLGTDMLANVDRLVFSNLPADPFTNPVTGNYLALDAPTYVVPDTTAPTVSLSDVAKDADEVSFNINSDEAGTANVQYRIFDPANPYAWGVGGTLAVTAGSAPFTITGLQPSTEYEFRVFVEDGAGNTSDPATTTVTTDAPPDTTAPTLTDETNVGGDHDTISFTANTDEAGTLTVYNGTTLLTTVAVIAGANAVAIDSLTPNTAYTFTYTVTDGANNISNIETISRTTARSPFPTLGDDLINGTNGDDVINALSGDDIVNGFDGSDVLNGGDDDDVLNGGAERDFITGGNGADTILLSGNRSDYQIAVVNSALQTTDLRAGAPDGSDRFDQIEFVQFADQTISIADLQPFEIFGTSSNDYLSGSNYDEIIYGYAGDDLFDGSRGSDTYIGGTESDVAVLYFRNSSSAAVFELFDGITIPTEYGNKTLFGIEGVMVNGSAYADQVTGGDGSDALYGYGGDDTFNGRGGADRLYGGVGINTLLGDVGNDTFVTEGNGYDLIDGGADYDVFDLSLVTGAGVTIDSFADGHFEVRKGTLIAAAEGIERVEATANSDTLDFRNLSHAIEVHGKAGHDEIRGGSGHDILRGGVGTDTLTGGGDSDTFAYDALGEGGDLITDFTPDLDFIQIDASGFGGNLTTGFAVHVGTSPTSGVPTFLYDSATGVISYDVDGSGSTASTPFITLGNAPSSISQQDFLWVA